MTPATVGVVLASTWLLQVPLFPLTGLFSTYLSGRGFSIASRGALAAVSVALAGAAMLGLAMAQPMWLVVALAAVCLGSQIVAGTVLPPLLAEVGRRLDEGLRSAPALPWRRWADSWLQ